MDKDIKEDWIEALRSGEYVQGREYLERANGRQCCLGVLCDILDLDWRPTWMESSVREYRYKGDRGISLLPPALILELGISVSEARLLTTMNDRGATLDEIADWIEVYL